MSQRRGFCVDAKSMGLSTSRPHSRGASGQQEPPEQQQRTLQTLDLFQQESLTSQQQQEQEVSNNIPEPELSPPAEQADQQSVQIEEQDSQLHTAAMPAISKVPSAGEARHKRLTTEHYRSQVEKLRAICGDSVNYQHNMKYVKRLEEIDCLHQECGGDSHLRPQLRLATLEDWVEYLLEVNFTMFSNMSALEMETDEKIMTYFQSVRGEQQQIQDENRKLRKDMCAILKLVQQAFHYNNWNTDEIRLETLTVNQVLGIPADQRPSESDTEKMAKSMKSLVKEVAAKHDEVCSMKSQMRLLDEVVQTAHQRIILKDEYIAQLRKQLLQLMELQDSIESKSQASEGRSGRVENQDASSYVDVYSSIANLLLTDINEKDYQMEDLLSMLNKELSELIDLISNKDLQAIQSSRKMLSGIFEKIFNERNNALNKLEKLRNQLRELDSDKPTANSTQISEDDFDMQLINAVRRRIKALSECNKDLHSSFQKMDTEYRIQLLEMCSAYESERSRNNMNEQVLKEIADLLSKLRGCHFSYNELYTEQNSGNPFIIVIMEMYEKLKNLERSRREETQSPLADNNNESATTAARKE